MTKEALQLKNDFLDWIRIQHTNIELTKKDEDHYRIERAGAYAEVNFYDLEELVVELKITQRQDDEVRFFLHFELNDPAYARSLFDEMAESLFELENRKAVRILLCCTAGMTTTYFAQKLNEAAAFLRLDYSFEAVAYTNVFEEGLNYDVILVSPQIGYLFEKIRDVMADKLVIAIPAKTFGSYDAAGMIELLRQSLSEQEKGTDADNMDAVLDLIDKKSSFMCVTILNKRARYEIHYHVFGDGSHLDSGFVRKNKYRLSDIDDMISTVLSKYRQIQKVFISTPGDVFDGKLTFKTFGIVDVDVVAYLKEKHGVEFTMCNDVHAMTQGYYLSHKEDLSDFVLIYTARNSSVGGAASVVNGHLLRGNHDRAGSIYPMNRILYFSENPSYLSKTPEGQVEICAKQLLFLIAVVAPQDVVICNPMITNANDVTEYLRTLVDEEVIPNIRISTHPIEYMIIGAVSLGL